MKKDNPLETTPAICPNCGSKNAVKGFVIEKVLGSEIIAYMGIGCPDCQKQMRRTDAKPIVLVPAPLE